MNGVWMWDNKGYTLYVHGIWMEYERKPGRMVTLLWGYHGEIWMEIGYNWNTNGIWMGC